MSWLERFVQEKLASLPKDHFVDRTFGFGDIQRVVEIVENAVVANAGERKKANRASLLAAARDPFPEGKGYATFTSMATDFWQTEMIFPRVARSALLIAIYSHTEYLLLSWCMSAAPDPVRARAALKRKNIGESTPERYLRFLRDDVGIAIGDFTTWPEREAIDGYRRARNCLAHNGGIVDDPDDSKKLAKLPKIQIDESGLLGSEAIVHLLPGACEAAARTAQAFVGRALAALEAQADDLGE